MSPEQTNLKTLLAEYTIPGARELTLPEKDGAFRCVACGHRCLIRPGKAGALGVRFSLSSCA